MTLEDIQAIIGERRVKKSIFLTDAYGDFRLPEPQPLVWEVSSIHIGPNDINIEAKYCGRVMHCPLAVWQTLPFAEGYRS